MTARGLAVVLLTGCANPAFAAEYYYSDTLTSVNASNWTQNGTVSTGSSGLTSASSGSLISSVTTPTGSSYEVKMTLGLTTSGGNFFSYMHATSTSLDPSGTFYATELSNPTFSGGACSAGLSVIKSVSGTITTLSSTSVPCHSGTVVRSVILPSGWMLIYVDNGPYIITNDTAISSGQPGVGVASAPSGNTVSEIDFGQWDSTPPGTVNAQSIGTSVLPTRVDMQWQGVVDNSGGSGLAYYDILRNGSLISSTRNATFSDETVTQGTTYTYEIESVDYHWNGATTTFTVTTPPSGSVDPREVGVRPTGTYWGGAGEQIDMLSGNLNYTVPLVKAMGRGNWSVGFNLTYNSQNWRQDLGGTWQLGQDVGYGYGWKMLAGSLIPIYSTYWEVDHYVFTDSTGAEYDLNQYNNGVYSSTQSIYVWFDSNTNELHFRDGSFWTMGSLSAGTEQDSGTLYPTIMEDTNGNQVAITYNDGAGVTWANSSARIQSIADVRSGGFSFLYSTTGGMPHLSSITDTTGSGENYSFSIATGQPLNSPFDGTSYGATSWAFLSSLLQTGTDLTTTFTYDSSNSGELHQVTTPYGGYLQWQYTGFTFSGTRTLREVQNRYLAMASGATERQYTMTRASGDMNNVTVHSSATWTDVTGNGQKVWQFQTSGTAFNVGLATSFEEFQISPNTAFTLTNYTWSQDPANNPYVSATLVTLDPGQTYSVQKQTTQTLDQYGNVTQMQMYGYGGNLLAACTNTYMTPYAGTYIFNRLLTSTVQNSGATQTATLVSNSYDQSTLTNNTSLGSHDATYTTSFTSRGNVTTSVTPTGTTTMIYDIGGNVLSTTQNGVTSTSTVTSATNYSLPSALTTNSLTSSINWTSFLGVSSQTGPNGDSASIGYDANARPTSTTSPYGAVTNYAYFDIASPPYTTATIDGRVTTTTMDGFGRTIKIVRSTGGTTVSTVDIMYEACGCSPLGKLIQQSQPYAPSHTEYWTIYAYDGIGRTKTVTAPDGSVTSYSYAGNKVTITDPAGNSKTFTMNALGNLVSVVETDPVLGSVTTTYTYDILNHLTQVSMPRGSTTQTRSFNYASGSTVGAHLLSAANPENGQVNYTYNSNGTLATKTDAKNQQIQYSYDSYNRVTQVRHYPVSGQPEDTNQQVNYYYDRNPFDTSGTFSYYTQGRLAALTYSTVYNELLSQQGPQVAEWYSYTQAGQPDSKRMQFTENNHPLNMDAFYQYDTEGRMTQVQYPNFDEATYGTSAPTYNYTFDTMGRLAGMTDQSSNTMVSGVQYGPSNELQGITYFSSASSVIESRTYNSRLQLTGLTVTQSSYPNTVIASLGYVYPSSTNNGKISQQNDLISGEQVQYAYDSLNRLASASTTAASDLVTTPWGESFSYDGFGNLYAKTPTKGSVPPLSESVDPTTNRLTGFTISYDANGNQTLSVETNCVYDVENRMVEATTYSNPTFMYAYSPQNKRVWKGTYDEYDNLTAQEVYFYGVDGKKLGTYSVSFSGTAGASSTDLLAYFGRRQVGKLNAGTMVPFVGDRLGSLKTTTSPATLFGFYPYGEDKGTLASNDQVKFASYTRDSVTLLDYADQRYYNNSLGRFMSPDPYKAGSGGNDSTTPQSWNRYGYVQGDPVNYYDPRGLFIQQAPVGPNGPTLSTSLPCAPDYPDPAFNCGEGDTAAGTDDNQAGSAQATPCFDWSCMPAALAQALLDLAKPGCGAAIFNGHDPATVLKAIIAGTQYGQVTFDVLSPADGAITIPKSTTTGHFWHRKTTRSAVIDINEYADPTHIYWNTGNANVNAITLIHELGHVFEWLFGSSSTSIVWDANADGSTNEAAEAQNQATLKPCQK